MAQYPEDVNENKAFIWKCPYCGEYIYEIEEQLKGSMNAVGCVTLQCTHNNFRAKPYTLSTDRVECLCCASHGSIYCTDPVVYPITPPKKAKVRKIRYPHS